MSKLTQDEKRARIIEFCKWEDISDSCHLRRTTYQCAVEGGLITLGDPFEDLNAMHEAEKALSLAQRFTYRKLLCRAQAENPYPDIHAVSATAAKRAEALGLALSLWKEGE